MGIENPKTNSGDKYSPEAIRKEITHEADRIRDWASEQGFREGEDFIVIEDIRDAVPKGEKIAPHEQKAFYMGIHDSRYGAFRDYFTGEYEKGRQQENPNARVKLNYSWGGRFLVDSDTVPCDTAPVTNLKERRVETKHAEFRQFFKEKIGKDFPTAEQLNPILEEISTKGLTYYQEVRDKIIKMDEEGTLPENAYRGMLDDIKHRIMVLENAKQGPAFIELPEVLEGKMDPKIRHYNDFTYNADDMHNLDRAMEVTGIVIPEELRTDKILERLGIDRSQMDDLCRQFSEQRFPADKKK